MLTLRNWIKGLSLVSIVSAILIVSIAVGIFGAVLGIHPELEDTKSESVNDPETPQ